MDPMTKRQGLDRHALAMSIWLALGLVAAASVEFGLGAGSAPFIIVGFLAILTAFVGHIIVNVLYGTTFTRGELALGLVVYGLLLVAFGVATLLWPAFRAEFFVPMSLGFLLTIASVVFYMITHFGLRRTFDAFDVIRDFRS